MELFSFCSSTKEFRFGKNFDFDFATKGFLERPPHEKIEAWIFIQIFIQVGKEFFSNGFVNKGSIEILFGLNTNIDRHFENYFHNFHWCLRNGDCFVFREDSSGRSFESPTVPWKSLAVRVFINNRISNVIHSLGI